MTVAKGAIATQDQHSSTQIRRVFLTMMLIFVYITVMAGVIWMIDYDPASVDRLPETVRVSMTFLLASFVISLISLLKISTISVWKMDEQVLPVWMTLTLISGGVIMFLRLPYSTVFMGLNWLSGLILLYVFARLISSFAGLRIGIMEGVEVGDTSSHHELLPVSQTAPIPQGLDAVIATPAQMSDPDTIAQLSMLAIRRVPVIPDHIYREQITGRVQIDRIDASELMKLHHYQRYTVIKRASDIIMAGVGLIVFMPVMIVLAVLIRLESPGHPIFVQTRTGVSDREFKMYKFRSMVAGADASGAQFAAQQDSRVTKIGRVIRKLRLDELPQLYNVLIGDMSMIGPRPEQKALMNELSEAIPLFRFRLMVRPGITGWAQVSQGYADDISSSDIKLSYDLFYIKNLSLMMDFVVFFKTLKIIITGFGSR